MMRDAFTGRPILTVYHEADGDWQYLTDGEAMAENAQLVHQSHVYDLDVSLSGLDSMPPGTRAVRQDQGSPWVISEDLD
ncbi:hypothetical protein [Geodermatophilus sp. DSM 44513]|uniref:hypothetical protein n=1 Tax=Geodermatophilus sp. DSM 44513 TaxID=1528104 RepID=UPI00141377A5|nr:hypothetical protein [Geodermatophilus sp. DSM 44513]WNV74294.1 hypothetical protein RTG05_14995 [Geodermatophilus sp. DSM 44513]